MAKKLCSWKAKHIKERLTTVEEIVREPQFLCKKCARVADRSKRLCKPVRIGERS